MRWSTAISIIGMLYLGGCATQGANTFQYSPSNARFVKNEKTVDRAQSVVWDELVRELSKSFFVINNIERESRIINVSFNSNSPQDYVDCGKSHRTYRQGDKVETFDYAFAEKSTYKAAAAKQSHPSIATYVVVNRVPTLEGRSNIYVAPAPSDSAKTVVSVNTRYILSLRITGEGIAQHANGNIVDRRQLPSNSSSYILNTNKSSSTPDGTSHNVVCSGNGHMETEILNMVR